MKLIFLKTRVVRFVFLLVVIFLVVFFVLSNKDRVSQLKIGSPALSQIELKSDGFHPDSLTIVRGTTVKFINSKGGPSWPASNPHPIHADYSEFDPNQPIAQGGSWSFTFNEAGVWGFHDHLSPYFTGKIIVVENLENGNAENSKCQLNPDTIVCWEESLLLTLNSQGLDKVLDRVSVLYATKPSFASVCHDVMHDVGHKAYKNYIEDTNSVINAKAFYCANGFYHGFMASFLSADPDLVKARDFCSLVGQKLKDSAPDAQLQCYHGIGHGLLDAGFQNGRVSADEQNMLDVALANCEKVSDSPEKLYRCTSGVFNGIANFYISGKYNLKINFEDPFSICEHVSDKYKESCYGNFNSIIFWLAKNDFSIASRHIIEMKDKKYREMSIRYLSGLAALSFAKISPEKAIIACRNLGDLSLPCLEGFAHGFLEHGQPNLEYQEAIDFCTNKTLTPEESDNCLKYTLSGLPGWYSRDRTAEICNSINPDYKKYCQKL